MADAAIVGQGVEAGTRAPNRLRAVFATSFGNLLEWYDVYAYTAFALYFAPSFFPKSDPVSSSSRPRPCSPWPSSCGRSARSSSAISPIATAAAPR